MSLTQIQSGMIAAIPDASVSTAKIADANITQAKLAANIAGNGPTFCAYLSTNQSISTNTWTKIAWNAEEFDTHNAFDSTTNYRFQPQVAGYYQIQGMWECNSSATYTYADLRKNNGSHRVMLTSQGSGVSSPFFGLVYLNGSTDYIDVWAYVVGGTSPNTIYGSQIYTSIQGFLVRAA
jgi:hypothetical protein